MIKILMSNAYVNKLIGKGSLPAHLGGNQVREIAARACGAQIKICSSLEQEKELQDCIVTIAGNLANKQDAVCIILEALEEFNLEEVAVLDPESSLIPRVEDQVALEALKTEITRVKF
jgi:hypothetical protein